MEDWKISSIAQFAQTLQDLESLSIGERTCLLLRRLATLYRLHQTFYRRTLTYSLLTMDLADGYPDHIKRQVTDVLLGQPWQQLINYGYIADTQETGSYSITSDGYQAAIECAHNPNRMTNREVQSAIKVLHRDFQSYEHYFREGKLKEAVAAAFERVENRLNEIRDESRKAAVKSAAGQSLVYVLFSERSLKLPYPQLGRGSRADLEKSLKGILSGALGWIRNPYTHEKHHLPDLEPQETLELLFVASYLMRMIEKSIPLRKAK